MLSLRGFALNLVCLATVSWLLVDLLTPAVELTRFRNSLLASVGEPADFYWEPADVPDRFSYETSAPPPVFVDVVQSIRSTAQTDVLLMSGLVEHLRGQPKRRGAIQSTTIGAYREIMETGRGYCADYTQVFNGLAYSAGLAVREWGLSFDRYSGDGHAFNEIYDAVGRRWVFVDPMHGFYVRDRGINRPLSALEFRDRLTSERGFESIEVVPIARTFLFDSGQEAFDYYKRGADQFWLWFGNDVLTYDAHPLLRFIGPWSRSLEQLTAIALGVHPEIRIFPTATNGSEIRALLQLRYKAAALVMAVLLFGTLSCLQALRWRRASARPRGGPGGV